MPKCLHQGTSCTTHGDLCVTCQAPTLHKGGEQRCGRCRARDHGERCGRCGSEWIHLHSYEREALCVRCVVVLAQEMGWDQPRSTEECQQMIKKVAVDLELLAGLRRERGEQLTDRMKRTTARRVQPKPAGPNLFDHNS